ncbi:MAG: rhodanese-like domain-containing protein [Vicinamibacterales bacterium]
MPVPRISREDLKARLDAAEDSRLLVVDARLKYPYEHSTVKIPGALRYSGDIAQLPKDKDLVLYDSDPDELVSARVAADLIRAGYTASALKGGIVEWLAGNLPTETKDAPKAAAPEPGALKG